MRPYFAYYLLYAYTKSPPHLLDLLLVHRDSVFREDAHVVLDRNSPVAVLVRVVEELLDGLGLPPILHALANDECGHGGDYEALNLWN